MTRAGLESHNEGLKNNQSIPNSLMELASRVSNVCTKHASIRTKRVMHIPTQIGH